MDALLAEVNPVLLFLAGCALLATILLRRCHRYFGKARRRAGTGPAIERQPRPQSDWDGAQADASARIERQKVELQDFARDASGMINSKMIMLQHLIRTSDRQIQRLETLLEDLERRHPREDGGFAEDQATTARPA
ncbi:MAG: hypothetical protein AAF961_03510 [Planctomycetota bacterium]